MKKEEKNKKEKKIGRIKTHEQKKFNGKWIKTKKATQI